MTEFYPHSQSQFYALVVTAVFGGVFRSFLMIAALISFKLENVARAVEPSKNDAVMKDRVQARIPDIEAYITSGIKLFDVPRVAIGIVAGDKLVYAKGFGYAVKAVVQQLIRARSFRSAQPPRHFSSNRKKSRPSADRIRPISDRQGRQAQFAAPLL
jgi:hypothetical protein